jgi:hypothetical protein
MTILKKNNKAFLLIHLGLGDVILCNGMINYLSLFYDSVVVVITNAYTETVHSLYKHNPKVSFYYTNRIEHICVQYGFPKKLFDTITSGYDVYSTGLFKNDHVPFTNFPLCFYDDINIPRSIFWTHSHIALTDEANILYDSIKHEPYVFVANKCSSGVLFDPDVILTKLNINKDDMLVINIHSNIYDVGHKFYDIAQGFLTHRPLTHYATILENAYANILTDSSTYSLCHILNIKTDRNYVVTRGCDFSHLYDIKSYEKEDVPIRVKFHRIVV